MQLQHTHCVVEGCDRPHKARGYCPTHYMQFKRGVEVVSEIKVRVHGRASVCSVAGCEKPEGALGLCDMHYARQLRHGSTAPTDRTKPLKPCKFPGCERPLLNNGFCSRHAQRQRKWKEHGLTMERFIEMGEAQNWLCAICEEPEAYPGAEDGEIRELSVDHCHEHGHIRGLLCNLCNRGLGMFQDNPDLLRKAAAYLDSHKALW